MEIHYYLITIAMHEENLNQRLEKIGNGKDEQEMIGVDGGHVSERER